MKKLSIFLTLLLSWSLAICQSSQPIRIGVIGLSHDHVNWIFRQKNADNIEIVGIAESDRQLAERYASRYGFSMDIVYPGIEALIEAKKPEGVTAFGSIYEHLEVVETCAPLGIHVMVEKPLAVSTEHATRMAELARMHNIHLITNYETTWYASNEKAHEMVKSGAIGELRKVMINDGHRGPIEIGVSKEFMTWLGDPVLNGGGALIDFGCYGANLTTWLMDGELPLSVTAVTQTNKPDLYPKVDDEATIILQYPKAQGIIQASWNWPFSRKDMEIYGETGQIISVNSTDMSYKLAEDLPLQHEQLDQRAAPFHDPFALFAALIRGETTLEPFDPSSLENNLIVVRILEAAKQSAATGMRVGLRDDK
jgi:predicted dehydrogenase